MIPIGPTATWSKLVVTQKCRMVWSGWTISGSSTTCTTLVLPSTTNSRAMTTSPSISLLQDIWISPSAIQQRSLSTSPEKLSPLDISQEETTAPQELKSSCFSTPQIGTKLDPMNGSTTVTAVKALPHWPTHR